MKITAFLGSPRANGNTDIITSRVIDGARDAGIETQTIALRKLNVRGCVGCSMCWKNGKMCAVDDDMTALYDVISGSDVLVFATPVYWYAPTAIMKAFIDRFVVFNHPSGRPLIEGKSAIIVTAYEEEGPRAAEPMLKMFDLSFDYLGVKLVDTIAADGVSHKGDVIGRPDILEKAYCVGLALGGR
ncbi:MAG: flavodoxin family protein [Armatimonadota bacterium]